MTRTSSIAASTAFSSAEISFLTFFCILESFPGCLSALIIAWYCTSTELEIEHQKETEIEKTKKNHGGDQTKEQRSEPQNWRYHGLNVRIFDHSRRNREPHHRCLVILLSKTVVVRVQRLLLPRRWLPKLPRRVYQSSSPARVQQFSSSNKFLYASLIQFASKLIVIFEKNPIPR